MTVPPESSPRRLVEQSITVAEGGVPRGPLSDREALRRLVEEIVQTMLEREFTRFLGAARDERSPERRGVRNGRRHRALVTRVGRLGLEIPRDRAGCFQPTVFARYQRHEQALLLTLTEC